MIRHTEEKIFTQEQTEALFKSAGWVSGNYHERLYKALMNSDTVITAWDGKRLAGLVRVPDDTEMVAYMHYLLVHPDYQGRGIAKNLLERVEEKYKDFFYIELMPEDKNNAPFYEKHGFEVMEGGTAMYRCRY